MLYGYHMTPFGTCVIGVTKKGICHLSFHEPDEVLSALSALQAEWPHETWKEDFTQTEMLIKQIFNADKNSINHSFSLDMHGTPFQKLVWQELVKIPYGSVTNYQQIARLIGKPKAARAVGHAIAQNKISYLVPCHRVISKSGKIHHYRWGVQRKRAMLVAEGCLKK